VTWRRQPGERDSPPERFMPAVRAGGRYVRHSPVVRRILFRAALFVVPGSALWALLPLVASRNLALDSAGYGLLLASLGIGAIAGALTLPALRTALSPNRLLFAAGVAYGMTLLVLATVRHTPTVLVALLPAGMAWVVVLSTVNAMVQLFLPAWVRARGLSVYQLVFAGGQALGALAFGVLASVSDLTVAHLSAAALMLAGALTIRTWPLRDVSGLSREPAAFWTEPQLTLEPEPDAGPVVVTVAYTVAPEREAEFVAQMQAVGRSRRRTGATRWGLFRAGEAEDTFVEVYLVGSWEEHLRQHEGRLTGADQDIELRARELAEGEPRVWHLLPAVPVPGGPRGPEV
jgi:MFS family permease